MTDNLAHHTVLIATDNMHEAGYIAKALEALDYSVLFCEFDGKTLKGTPLKSPDAVLFVFTDYIEKAPNIIKVLKSHFSPHNPTIIGALTRDGDIDRSVFDSVIFPPAHITQIANRVSSLIRLGQMEREINRRIITLKDDFDIEYSLSEASLTQPFRILFIGKATPDFMVIINALQKKNVEVVAAFTSFSAFDYLHEGSFDAVVMNALEQSEPALTISETMRRNAKLYHVPTLFLVNSETFQDHELAYNKGARDIISADSDTKEISGRILELANYHKIHSQLKGEFDAVGDNCIDENSNVFNEAFFRAHLTRVTAELGATQDKLSVIAIKARANSHFKIPADKIEAAMAQVGQMLKNLVRMQDITARLSSDIFIIAFPEQDLQSVSVVIDRIAGIVDCAAFDSGNNENGAFTVSLETSIVEYMGHESSDELISHALAELNANMPDQLKAG